jgi:hypothetical protein
MHLFPFIILDNWELIVLKKMFISMKLFLLKYCDKKHLKENTLPNSIVLYFAVTNMAVTKRNL